MKVIALVGVSAPLPRFAAADVAGVAGVADFIRARLAPVRRA